MIKKIDNINKLSKIGLKVWSAILNFTFILPALCAFSLQRVMSLFPSVVEFLFSSTVFRWIAAPISFLTSLVPFSLTELLMFLSIPIVVFLTYLFIKKLKKSSDRKVYVLKSAKRIGWILSFMYLSFMLLMGFNYAREPLNVSLGITVKDRSKEDLKEVCYILLERTNTSREKCVEDKDGVMKLKNGIGNALKTGYKGFNAVSGVYPALLGAPGRAKGVMVSHLWSYTGITGMYFPFFVEANVNIDAPDAFIPDSIMHELSHLRGIAREDEAEFAAFLTGINHPDNDFKYSSYLSAYLSVAGSLYGVDTKEYDKLSSMLSDAVKRDINSNYKYWKQFEGPVQNVSTSVNNAYLQSNLQQDGVKSYGRVVDLLLGYYLS